jgi:hypothetical protein
MRRGADRALVESDLDQTVKFLARNEMLRGLAYAAPLAADAVEARTLAALLAEQLNLHDGARSRGGLIACSPSPSHAATLLR